MRQQDKAISPEIGHANNAAVSQITDESPAANGVNWREESEKQRKDANGREASRRKRICQELAMDVKRESGLSSWELEGQIHYGSGQKINGGNSFNKLARGIVQLGQEKFESVASLACSKGWLTPQEGKRYIYRYATAKRRPPFSDDHKRQLRIEAFSNLLLIHFAEAQLFDVDENLFFADIRIATNHVKAKLSNMERQEISDRARAAIAPTIESLNSSRLLNTPSVEFYEDPFESNPIHPQLDLTDVPTSTFKYQPGSYLELDDGADGRKVALVGINGITYWDSIDVHKVTPIRIHSAFNPVELGSFAAFVNEQNLREAVTRAMDVIRASKKERVLDSLYIMRVVWGLSKMSKVGKTFVPTDEDINAAVAIADLQDNQALRLHALLAQVAGT